MPENVLLGYILRKGCSHKGVGEKRNKNSKKRKQ